MIIRCLLVLLAVTGFASAQEVNLLAMGDWGHPKDKQQETVARTMAKYVGSANHKFDAMLTAGDNFYVHLEDIHDPKWKTMFEEMYDPKILDFPFYIALGNHDYERDRFLVEFAYAQANPWSRWKLPARWYRIDFPATGQSPLVSVLVLDSDQPLMSEYAWKKQTEWLKAEAEKPRKSKWLVAIAHHPFFSNGEHGDNGVLRREWSDLFTKLGIDIYICGHDHDLQHLQVEGFNQTFLLVGGGGATTRPMRNDQRGPFSSASYGFAHLQFTDTQAKVRLIDGRKGATLHEFTRTPDGKITIANTTPSDKATPRTVKSITRGDATQPASQPSSK